MLFDSADPLWAFCHKWSPTASREESYAPGAAEVTWEYGDDGGIERIDVQCLVDEPYLILPEHDETGRVVRWNEGGREVTDLVYDDAGAIVESSRVADEMTELRSLTYRDDGKLDTQRLELSQLGALVQSEVLDLRYDGDRLASASSSSDDVIFGSCSTERTYSREAGRLVRVLREVNCDVGGTHSERTYEWSGEHLARSTWVARSELGEQVSEWEEEVRYRYEGDRIAEVQRDRDGEPYATYWYEYDEAGRPVHLVWWGHVEMPLPLP